MTNDITTILYLLSGVLFILAIRGLSSPDTARTGNYLGITGMAIAFIVTIVNLEQNSLMNWLLIVFGILRYLIPLGCHLGYLERCWLLVWMV